MVYLKLYSAVVVLYTLINCFSFVYSYDDGGIVEDCVSNELAFGCKRDDTFIVIKEAWLHDGYHRQKGQCLVQYGRRYFTKGSILQHISKKCSTQRVCKFNVWKDVPGAVEDKRKWKNGIIRLDYECVRRDALWSVCASTVTNQTGWLTNIGYPEYYLGPGACTFTIKVDVGQHIMLSIIDLSIRAIIQPTEQSCRDRLSVKEGNREHLSACGDSNRPKQIKSEGNILNVTLHSSVGIFTKRGFLVYYQAVGCQTPPTPEDGYMSHRNKTHAQFWCCVRHVFTDTMNRVRDLKCLRQRYWDQSVTNCTDLNVLLAQGNITEEQYWIYNGTSMAHRIFRPKNIEVIIIPSSVLLLLVLINAVIMQLLLKRRRQLKASLEGKDEFATVFPPEHILKEKLKESVIKTIELTNSKNSSCQKI